jgi:hypothetical protein
MEVAGSAVVTGRDGALLDPKACVTADEGIEADERI